MSNIGRQSKEERKEQQLGESAQRNGLLRTQHRERNLYKKRLQGKYEEIKALPENKRDPKENWLTDYEELVKIVDIVEKETRRLINFLSGRIFEEMVDYVLMETYKVLFCNANNRIYEHDTDMISTNKFNVTTNKVSIDELTKQCHRYKDILDKAKEEGTLLTLFNTAYDGVSMFTGVSNIRVQYMKVVIQRIMNVKNQIYNDCINVPPETEDWKKMVLKDVYLNSLQQMYEIGKEWQLEKLNTEYDTAYENCLQELENDRRKIQPDDELNMEDIENLHVDDDEELNTQDIENILADDNGGNEKITQQMTDFITAFELQDRQNRQEQRRRQVQPYIDVDKNPLLKYPSLGGVVIDYTKRHKGPFIVSDDEINHLRESLTKITTNSIIDYIFVQNNEQLFKQKIESIRKTVNEIAGKYKTLMESDYVLRGRRWDAPLRTKKTFDEQSLKLRDFFLNQIVDALQYDKHPKYNEVVDRIAELCRETTGSSLDFQTNEMVIDNGPNQLSVQDSKYLTMHVNDLLTTLETKLNQIINRFEEIQKNKTFKQYIDNYHLCQVYQRFIQMDVHEFNTLFNLNIKKPPRQNHVEFCGEQAKIHYELYTRSLRDIGVVKKKLIEINIIIDVLDKRSNELSGDWKDSVIEGLVGKKNTITSEWMTYAKDQMKLLLHNELQQLWRTSERFDDIKMSYKEMVRLMVDEFGFDNEIQEVLSQYPKIASKLMETEVIDRHPEKLNDVQNIQVQRSIGEEVVQINEPVDEIQRQQNIFQKYMEDKIRNEGWTNRNRNPNNMQILKDVSEMLIGCHPFYEDKTWEEDLIHSVKYQRELNMTECLGDYWVYHELRWKKMILLFIKRFFNSYAVQDRVIYIIITTKNGKSHAYPLKNIQDEDVIDSGDETFWDEYKGQCKDGVVTKLLPIDTWNNLWIQILSREEHRKKKKAQGNLQGHFFPYNLNLLYKELAPMFEPFGIYVQGDKVDRNNCFMYSLEQWNNYAIKHPENQMYVIPQQKLDGIKTRLFGKGVKLVSLNRIAEEFDIVFKVVVNVVYTSEDAAVQGKKNPRRDNRKLYGKKDCTNVVELGLIMIDSVGHYFCDIPTRMTVAGVKHYHEICKMNNRKTPEEMISIHSFKVNQHGKWYPDYKRTKHGVEVQPPYAKASIIINAMVDSMNNSDLLVKIPNAFMYNGAASLIRNNIITNPMIRQEDCREITFQEKVCKDIVYVADTECSIQGRHIPYAIAFCPYGEEDKIISYIGSDCIQLFIKHLDEEVFDKIVMTRKTDKKDDKKRKEQKRIVVYFHNLSYDGRMFTDYKIVSISMNGNRIIQMALLTPKGNRIVLRDSYMLIPVKLAAFPRMFNTKEKEKQMFPYAFVTQELIAQESWDHTVAAIATIQKWSNEQMELFVKTCKENKCISVVNEGDVQMQVVNVKRMIKCYVESDVRILDQGLKTFREDIKEALKLDLFGYLSISAVAYAYTKKEAYHGEQLYEYTGELRDYIRQAVYGGRCMTRCNICYSVRDEPIDDFDACSLYPSAMSVMKLPKGTPKRYMSHDHNNHYDNILDEQDKTNLINQLQNETINAAIMRIRVTDIGQPLAFPLIPRKDSNGVWQYTNEVPLEMFVDDVMLMDLIKWQKIEFVLLEAIYWDQGCSTKINDCIKTLYDKRKEAKQQGKTIQEVYKLIMNSSYGKTIEKPHVVDVTPVKGSDECKQKMYKDYSTINSVIEVDSLRIHNAIEDIEQQLTNPELDWVDKVLLQEELDNLEKEKQYLFNIKKDYDEFWSPTMIGVRVLSTSKMLMNSVMVPAELEQIIIFYQDTDSVHVFASQVEQLEHAWRKWNNKRDDEKLIGSDLCQFHSDFPEIKVNGKLEKSMSVYSIFIAKKIYMDYLIPKDDYEQGKHYSEYDNCHVVVRMKGVPLKAMQLKQLPSHNVGDELMVEIYEGLFDGKGYVFDIAAGVAKLQLTKDMVVTTVESFERRCKPPKVARYKWDPDMVDWTFNDGLDCRMEETEMI